MNTNSNPTISVIMSVYNGAKFLDKAVKSILNQTYQNYEFLIMDDGSTDATAKILDEFAKKSSVKIFSRGNKGLTASLNELISIAKGEYIARMDADDFSHPKRFEKQVEYLDHHSECGLVGTGSFNIDENGRIINGYQLPDNHNFLLGWLEKGINVYKHASIMMRKSILNMIPGPYRFYYGQDFDLYLRLSEIARLGMVHEVLFKYRVFGDAIQGIVSPIRERQIALMLNLFFKRKQGKSEGDWQEEERKILLPFWSEATKTNDTCTAYANATSLFQEGRFKEARKCFFKTQIDTKYKNNARGYIFLTYLPKVIALSIQRTISWTNDKWKSYRIPPKLWPHINKGFINH